MQIVYCDPGRRTGWDPITWMVRLAGGLFETEPLVLDRAEAVPGLARKLALLAPRRRGQESCLLVCPHPQALWMVLAVEGWRRRFDRIAAWVIDSFWAEEIPWAIRRSEVIDEYFVTNLEEVELWARLTRKPCRWLPWGTDALGLGQGGPARPVDLLRLGRQPDAWERDEETAGACDRHGLTFAGRPPGQEDQGDNERMLMRRLAGTKYVLCFTNRVNQAGYTHPTREYITGRWVDALGGGACVAGVHPRTETVRRLLWPEGLLELGTTDRERGLAAIASAARGWAPEQAALNHRRALERLDWRHRFADLAAALGGPGPRLTAELARLRQAVASPGEAAAG